MAFVYRGKESCSLGRVDNAIVQVLDRVEPLHHQAVNATILVRIAQSVNIGQ